VLIRKQNKAAKNIYFSPGSTTGVRNVAIGRNVGIGIGICIGNGIGIALTGIQKSGVLGGRDLVWISCG